MRTSPQVITSLFSGVVGLVVNINVVFIQSFVGKWSLASSYNDQS